tara:strand:- start:2522 stop:2845 length:324 start_codon:yes stop_codon:yes gene_type:complete
MAKSKPIGVRFDLEKLELIQKEQNLASPQAVVNYFLDGYKTISFDFGVPNVLAKRGAPFKNMPPYDTNSPNLANKPKTVEIPVENQITPPKGLKGIDLVIWKSENWK